MLRTVKAGSALLLYISEWLLKEAFHLLGNIRLEKSLVQKRYSEAPRQAEDRLISAAHQRKAEYSRLPGPFFFQQER